MQDQHLLFRHLYSAVPENSMMTRKMSALELPDFEFQALLVLIATMDFQSSRQLNFNLFQRLGNLTEMMKFSRLACAATISAMVVLTAGCASTATQESTGQMVDSSVITTNVKAALAGNDLETLLAVEVETFRDVVQLSGFVDTEEEKTVAGEIARGVDGVVKVENNLIVKPPAS